MGIITKIKDAISKPDPYNKLQFYDTRTDGYTENPLAHGQYASETDMENEYFMQWVFPEKLHTTALRTPLGYRLTYGYAKDFWNNDLGISIPDDKKKSREKNRKLREILRKKRWFKEMQKLTAYQKEQGESILICYYGDEGDISNYNKEVSNNRKIKSVEAINYMNYYIESFDLYGNPEKYILLVRDDSYGRGLQQIKVDASRVLRLWGENVEYRYKGYSPLAAVYDSITIMGTILKGTGEAAFRWGTGHPVIFTKDIFKKGDMEFLKSKIGDFTREDWHMLPNEFVESVELLGQAGSMLNFKALADIVIDQVIIGTGFPRTILMGEGAGVTGGEVNERSYFAMLDADHTEYQPFIKDFFEKSPQIRNLLSDIDFYELDWGVREVMNKKERVEYEQKEISNALALTQICTIDECRERLGLEPLGDDQYGDVVLGLQPFYMAEVEMAMREMEIQSNLQNNSEDQDQGENYKEHGKSTEKQKNSTEKDLEKNKKSAIGQEMNTDAVIAESRKLRLANNKKKLKDTMDELMKDQSTNKICKSLEIYPKTWNKVYRNLEVMINEVR